MLLLFAVSVKSQDTGIEGQYGILNYGNYTLEGVVENSSIRSTNYGIKIYKDGRYMTIDRYYKTDRNIKKDKRYRKTILDSISNHVL